jgi:hypothetical protein
MYAQQLKDVDPKIVRFFQEFGSELVTRFKASDE